MAHGDARDGKWRGNWRMEWVASTLHTTSEHGVSSIITADTHTSAASSRLNWRTLRFKWTRTCRRKTKCGFCACAITFQLASNNWYFIMQHSSSHWNPLFSIVCCWHLTGITARKWRKEVKGAEWERTWWLSEAGTVKYAITKVIGSRNSFVIASVRSSIHWNVCI